MAYSTDTAPHRPQDVQQVAEMLRGLEAKKSQGKQRGISCKKATFTVTGTQLKVDSWKMSDWDYKKPNLPTYARGLFTARNDHGHPEIVVRGYDKFFNHGEVRETEWPNIEENTRGPYELSVKENGCIIFIAGLESGDIIVCSKHSTGSRSDTDLSHAEAGERWVERHLASVGKTKADLARRLREMNATAVAELCDDDFEEHVLEYRPEAAGLYLHGINLNLPEFATYPHHLVDAFADEWGFKKTMYILKDNVQDVHSFLDEVAETGNYAGRDTEGFVIRCQSKYGTGEWHDWFFKYKFEEPYLMYRQWRECTKAIINGREPRVRNHKKITEEYLLFARQQLHAHKGLGQAYMHNHGIIKLRDAFLASRGLNGHDIIRQEAEAEGAEVSNATAENDIVLVPVATLGCGKTTIALALTKLFENWGHIQNDNITVKSRKPQAFANACSKGLIDHPVMIADRNNHQRRERQQLYTDISAIIPRARYVALHFVHDRDRIDDIRTTLRARVLGRGDNHQTIHTSKGEGEIIGIMEGFLHRFEPVRQDSPPDDGFDFVIDLDPLASSRENLETVISALYVEFPRLFAAREASDGGGMPTAEDMDAAIDAALHGYTVDLKHEIKGRDDNKSNKNNRLAEKSVAPAGPPKAPKVEYFGITVSAARINAILSAMFHGAPPDVARMYNALKQQRRIQAAFHVTLCHRASAGDCPEIWQHLNTIYEQVSKPTAERAFVDLQAPLGKSYIKLERLVWNDRIMAFVVRLAPIVDGGEHFRSANITAHITVGTASPDIKPKESNDLLETWLRIGSGSEGIQELAVAGNVELEGTAKAVLAR
ncbi:tRNA ligase [Dissoconium aciculare CBS 342.82]|uniref:tRNA ligase n=1 Tax=Dissoconium aciculare CBS 342.82 TaxID=1314786 RepID=A0A6J3MH65_9PEZI|nr:tRNA ligase [Dissoconium aciculare CBS 342.82]KAF1826237.1 tRNA ligase [Dissoconium aciculare CBS 342.82]